MGFSFLMRLFLKWRKVGDICQDVAIKVKSLTTDLI